MEFYLKENGMRIDLDYGELSISGNEDHGYRPFQLMVASIAGCSGSVFRKILEKQRTEVEDIIINADVERNPEEANRIERISLKYTIKGYHLDPEKLYKNLEISRRNCSMIRSVEGSIKIEESMETIELSI
ncbi:osmotically inducible protein C [Virgibacillus profundi]|uniref:Osmotically inducible protein C n=1 Tax=Virgibacillus profundi TaxID=2024555 RepID=A0A2A2I9V6_9BACI|nr:OsmC family protein [Virgibacillus profundi]PAV28106.1 osmotically inducible protein C [Virgibacillus profundi]PXY52411.1 OsmC family peroxiredoxin [Virgibacillus profundi]